MKNRIEYKGFYIDKTENGYRISRKEDTEKKIQKSILISQILIRHIGL